MMTLIRKPICRFCACVVLGLSFGSSYAQHQPLRNEAASGFILQQQRERALQEQLDTTADVPGAKIELPDVQQAIPQNEIPFFPIERIILEGEMADRFQWALESTNWDNQRNPDPALGRCLGNEGINIVMGRIQNAIIKRGYITTRVVAWRTKSYSGRADPDGDSWKNSCNSLCTEFSNSDSLEKRFTDA